ncbi:hypothetical protein GCM10027174_35660 [Salinifilum aidingensis]
MNGEVPGGPALAQGRCLRPDLFEEIAELSTFVTGHTHGTTVASTTTGTPQVITAAAPTSSAPAPPGVSGTGAARCGQPRTRLLRPAARARLLEERRTGHRGQRPGNGTAATGVSPR